MAVQKSRVTPSRRGMRRSHDALTAKQLATDPTSGETHLRHHITADGYYRGKQVIQPKTVADDRAAPGPASGPVDPGPSSASAHCGSARCGPHVSSRGPSPR